MLFVVYNYNFFTKFVLILPVFYYYVTPNFFYSPPTFGSPCIFRANRKRCFWPALSVNFLDPLKNLKLFCSILPAAFIEFVVKFCVGYLFYAKNHCSSQTMFVFR